LPPQLERLPEEFLDPLPAGRAMAWHVASGESPLDIAVIPPKGAHLRHIRKYARHIRKYAAGELGKDKSFYFVGRKTNYIFVRRILRCSVSSPKASTKGHGVITLPLVTIRSGCGDALRTKNSPKLQP
jgi:hypothetical protein